MDQRSTTTIGGDVGVMSSMMLYLAIEPEKGWQHGDWDTTTQVCQGQGQVLCNHVQR
ncbi:TPA: hypothetical protein SMP48_000389 [Proteus mirabilis]|nr:hypothetical protein [Proteus mirabilis]